MKNSHITFDGKQKTVTIQELCAFGGDESQVEILKALFPLEEIPLNTETVELCIKNHIDVEWYLRAARTGTGWIRNQYGTTMWYKDGALHREDGPAVKHINGGEEWYWHGELHREDGPAVKYSDGEEEWYWHGELRKSEFK
jgi:hypothetical protein